MIDQDYVSTGRVQIALKHFPLPQYPNAATYANAIVCAGRQGRAFDMLDAVLRGDGQDPLDIDLIATMRGFNSAELRTCMSDPTTIARVNADSNLAIDNRVNGVPWFVLYSTVTGRCMTVAGNYPAEVFRTAIEEVAR
jgi:protein-disulfide isomerase